MKRLIATLFASFLFWACSDNASDTAGATSETTNGIAFRVVDADSKPLAMARVSLYSVADMVKQDSAVADSEGVAVFAAPEEDCYLEAIAGSDSSLMAFEPFDTTATEVLLKPASTVVLNYSALDSSLWSGLELFLLNTPYSAKCVDGGDLGECVFAHVPAGEFEIVKGSAVGEEPIGFVVLTLPGDTSIVTTVPQDTAVVDTTVQDTSDGLDTVAVQDTTARDTLPADLFEDFDDGDSLTYYARKHFNYGWYFNVLSEASFVRPDSGSSFVTALDSNVERGYYLSTKFDLGDSGMVLIGSHIGEDTAYFDMSSLAEIRITLRGDGDVYVALEHYMEVEENSFNKALWYVKATEEWTEFVLKPGEEIIMPEAHEVEFNTISKEIALFSIFVSSGTFLEVDKIEFAGVKVE